MRKPLEVGLILVLLLWLGGSEGTCLSSWSLLTEREWVPEVFGFSEDFAEPPSPAYFLGVSRSLKPRFRGFVGLGIGETSLPGFSERRNVLAGFVFNPRPGLSFSLEFEDSELKALPGEPDDDKVTFRTVISF